MMQAMIFAAGLGTRLKPLTDTMPKALVRVDGIPLIEHVAEKMKCAGVERIVVNVHHFAGQVISFLHDNGNFGMDIRISDESDMLLDTGGGIKKALPMFIPDEPVLIHNVDILSNVDFPQPDGPIIDTNSLSFISKLTLLRAIVSTSVVRNTLLKFSILIMTICVFYYFIQF